jgi:hypothetical protein
MKPATARTPARRSIPEARVTGRPRLVVGRTGGIPEMTDGAAYALVTLALTAIAVLPALLGRYS